MHTCLLAQQGLCWWDLDLPIERQRKPKDGSCSNGFTTIKYFTIVKCNTIARELGKFHAAANEDCLLLQLLLTLLPYFSSIFSWLLSNRNLNQQGKTTAGNSVEVYKNSFVPCNESDLAVFLPHLHFLSTIFIHLDFHFQ